jgi:hypothetical protein
MRFIPPPGELRPSLPRPSSRAGPRQRTYTYVQDQTGGGESRPRQGSGADSNSRRA